MSIYNILITGTGGCGVGEGLYKSLKPLEKYAVFSCNNSDNSLFVFDDTEMSFIVPSATDSNYCAAILKICRQNDIKVIIPGSEHELTILISNREKFDEAGVIVFANTAEVITTFDNKWETFLKLSSLNIHTPDTTLDINDEAFFKRNNFPLIVKPIYGNASKNVFVIDSMDELHCIIQYLNYKRISFVIQEYIGTANEEYTISVLSDLDGNFLGSIVLKRNLAGGFSQFVVCEEFEELDEIAQKIAKDVNSKGPLNIQCRMMHGELYVFEINPRFSGTTPFRTLLGFNEADILFQKVFEGVNNFDKNEIKVGSFGVRGFQEKIYNNQVKSEVVIAT